MLSANGPPTLDRKSRFDEFKVFAPSVGRGLSELVTETLVLLGITWLCRDGLKIRLEAKRHPVQPVRRSGLS